MAGNLIIILIVAFLAWAFASVFSFIPFLVGVIFGFFNFLINLVSFNLYPVGPLPRILVGGSLVFIVVMFFVKLLTKNH